MSSTNLIKNWMKASRLTYDFLNGVRSFIDYVKQTLGDMTYCPCNKCRNVNGVKIVDEIRTHLITYGIDQSYTTWYFHGESRDASVDAHIQNPNKSLITQHDDVERPRMFDLFDDAFGYIQPEDLYEGTQDGSYEGADEFPEEEIEYQKLKDDASRLLYPSCLPSDTMLSATIELMSLKSTCQLSDSGFTMLLVLLKRLLPKDNTLPESMYVATKMIKCLGMNYENIDACPNNCILYWREHRTKEKCPICGVSRWKSEYLTRKKSRKIPVKVLKYFPLTPRLKRLYRLVLILITCIVIL
ncbi:hypothetical protein GIB67_017915 [Kingdonia uniflora]|uniref:Transposase-associated domain-containing protein n=1 Tax=Kingdonia uniflora TaxID=39325 RepID=A0A7J7NED3_9MAGN|nr:hypothetical protein GIB67_017915 [Kingdonia uniflora]